MERLVGKSVVMVVLDTKGNATLAILTVPPPNFKDILECSEAESLLEKARKEHQAKSRNPWQSGVMRTPQKQ